MGIDACHIPPDLIPQEGVIWFQCPWNSDYTIGTLIQDFLLNVAEMIDSGTYVCLGLTKYPDFVDRYCKADFLGSKCKAVDDSTEVLKQYTFLGEDDTLIKMILSFGYRHRACWGDVHNKIFEYHETLIFQKKPPPDTCCNSRQVMSPWCASSSPSRASCGTVITLFIVISSLTPLPFPGLLIARIYFLCCVHVLSQIYNVFCLI